MDDAAWQSERRGWDSDFWSRRVAMVACGRGSSPTVAALEAELRDVDFAYLLCDPDRVDHLAVAEDVGFRTVDVRCDVRVDLEVFEPPAPFAPIRVAQGSDLHQAATLAARSHFGTRFGNDRHLDRGRVGKLYERWVWRDSELAGWRVQVAVVDSVVCGYVTHGPVDATTSTIGLIAVDPAARREGLGGALLAAALGAERATGRRALVTATQGGSAAALRLYQRAGFDVERLRIWMHWHRR